MLSKENTDSALEATENSKRLNDSTLYNKNIKLALENEEGKDQDKENIFDISTMARLRRLYI